jgi:replicative superfamily II helicase
VHELRNWSSPAVSTLRELEFEQVSPQLLEILRRQGLVRLTGFQNSSLNAGIMRNTSQLLVTYDYDEAYQIAEIALLNRVASGFRAKAIILCPNPHHVEKRFRSVGHKCRRLGIEASMCTRATLAGGDNWKDGRVIVSTYRALSVAVKTAPETFEGLSCAIIERLDLIGQPDLGAHLESSLVAIMSHDLKMQYIAITPPVADINELSTWLNAKTVEDTVADVKRIFSIKVFESVTESLADLTEFVHYRQGQIAILCSNIGTCEDLAIQLSGIDTQTETPELDLRLSPEQKDDLRDVAREVMKQYPNSNMTVRLSKIVSKGVAFIHEGVSKKQRRTISGAWEDGILPVILMPASFAVASGIRATVVFLIGLYTQDVRQYLSENEDFTILSEWQLGDLLYSAGRRGIDNDAFGIVVVDDKSERDRVFAQYFIEDEEGNISPRLGEVDSSMDDPENAQELVLRHICGKSGRPDNLFSVLDRTYWAQSNRMLEISDDELLLSDTPSVERNFT